MLKNFVYIFETSEPIYTIFGVLQRRFMLNPTFDSKFTKFIVQDGATWRRLSTRILL